jgi:Zn-dependent peptidase ImmA (M78 family)/DNA-binding XRE family transcriptional regulator
VNVEALRVAREALGLTQTDLASRSRLEQSDLSRWERGVRTPNDDQVQVLADALQIPVSMLTNEGLRFSQPVHRTQREETKRTERMVNGRIELARVIASRLLADINVDTPFAFPTPEDPTPAGPEEAAEAIRRVWRIPAGPIDDLTAIVESAGAVVAPVDFGYHGVLAAYSNLRNDHRWCFINTRATDGAQVRFSLAHEIGHALLHWHRFDAPTGKDAEREANRFAAALLMPRGDIMAALGRARITLDELVAFRRRWRVSVQALMRRALDLGLITGDHYTGLYKQLSRRGWRKSEPVEIPVEKPSILTEALNVQRNTHRYSDDELAEIAGFSRERLADLLPEHFAPPAQQRGRPALSIVR